MKQDEILYGCDGDLLVELDIETVMERVLDDFCGVKAPLTVEILEFRRMKLEPWFLKGDILEFVNDRLWESELGGEDPPGLTENEKLKEAEAVFIEAIRKEFVPWACEPNGVKHTIDCKEWVAEHRPEWLPDIEWEES